MARARSRSGRRADLRWTFGSLSVEAQGAGSSTGTIVQAGNTSQTLMRVRGQILGWLDGVQTPPVSVHVGVGFIITQDGATPTSLPLTDGDAPFLYYQTFALAYEEYVTDVIDATGTAVFRHEIDVKSMRIIRPDQKVSMVVENATIAGAGSINVHVGARFLLAD